MVVLVVEVVLVVKVVGVRIDGDRRLGGGPMLGCERLMVLVGNGVPPSAGAVCQGCG